MPPTAEHVEKVCRLLSWPYRLRLLWLEWSGARLSSVETITVETSRRVRFRKATQKTRAALWVELHPTLADALAMSRPDPRETVIRSGGRGADDDGPVLFYVVRLSRPATHAHLRFPLAAWYPRSYSVASCDDDGLSVL